MMLTILARASIDGAVFAALIWALTRTVPRLPPAAKAFLWWCATVKFALALITTPVPLPVLPAEPVSPAHAISSPVQPLNAARAAAPAAPDARGSSSPIDVLVALWLSGVAIALAAGMRRWAGVRREIGASRPAPDAVQQMTAEVAARLGLSRVPRVRISDTIATPLVAGILRPTIVVPAAPFARLGEDAQRMTLCHELAHLKRGDLWFGCAAALAERAFFFHPFARAAAREYAFWREAACDALVLETLGAAPHAYGRLLLDLGVAAPRRTLAAAGAAWSFSNLKRRIVMLRPPASRSLASRALAASALTLAAAGVVPVTLVARPAAPALLAAPPSPTVAPAAVAAPQPPPVETRELQARMERAKQDDLAFVAFVDDVATMSGSADDMTRARQLHRPGESMMWVRRLGVEYIVRDESILREIRRAWEPVDTLGGEQGRIGDRQAQLGDKQAEIGERHREIGERQWAVGALQADAGTRQAAISSLAAKLRSEVDRAEYERQQRDLMKLTEEMDRLHKEVAARIASLEKPMQELSERLEAMSRDMETLSRKMTAATAKAQADTRAIVDRAIASGLAEIVR